MVWQMLDLLFDVEQQQNLCAYMCTDSNLDCFWPPMRSVNRTSQQCRACACMSSSLIIIKTGFVSNNLRAKRATTKWPTWHVLILQETLGDSLMFPPDFTTRYGWAMHIDRACCFHSLST